MPVHVTTWNFIPHQQDSPPNEVLLYQKNIGSVIYLGVITHPDIAYAASLLARFLQNSAPNHQAESNHLICYLRDINNMAIKDFATAASTFITAVDATCADDKATGCSTHGWIFILFGRLIDWKSGRQPSIGISSTEAELLALSHVASMVLW
jgi:hypothetical protein